MARIKSAFEKAMERIEQIEAPDPVEKLEWEFVPLGRKLAGLHMKSQGDPFKKFSRSTDEAKPYLKKGMIDVLIANIQLPKSENIDANNKRSFEGLTILLQEDQPSKDLLERAIYVTQQYAQYGNPQREQAYFDLKKQIEQVVIESLSRQGGGVHPQAAGNIRVETMPEFQQQWMKISGQIDHQYEQHINQIRQELINLP